MKNFDARECIFYHIYPLGFCGAPKINENKAPVNRIKDIEKWIPHIKNLGVNALYLGPVFDSGCHGYDTHDYTRIDPRLGTNEDFGHFCEELRRNSIHLVLDGVFNHVGRGHFAFADVLRNREKSPYCNWISGLDFKGNNKYNDNLKYDNWAGHDLLVKLNLKNPEVTEHLLSSVEMWIDKFGIAGLRLDAADCIDHDFFRELRKRCKAKKPDFWLMGEITDSDDYREWMNSEMLDSVTNYECYTSFYKSINTKDMHKVADDLQRQFGEKGIYRDYTLYSFLDNHDVNRIATRLRSKQNLKNLYTLMYTVPGAPSVYYGSEWAAKGKKEPRSDAALRPAIDVENPHIIDHSLMEHLSNLAKIRSASPALMYGYYTEIATENETFAFARTYKDETKLIFINIANSEKTICADFGGKHYATTLPPHSSKITDK